VGGFFASDRSPGEGKATATVDETPVAEDELMFIMVDIHAASARSFATFRMTVSVTYFQGRPV